MKYPAKSLRGCSIKMTKLLESVRCKLLRALDLLIEPSSNSAIDEAFKILSILSNQFSGKEQLYSIESLVFNVFINNIQHPYTQARKENLLILREELLGLRPHWHSYVAKNNFTKDMTDLASKAYFNLKSSLKLYTKEQLSNDDINNIDNLIEELHLLCNHDILISSLSDLIISQASHVFLSLPFPPQKTIDLLDFAGNWGTLGSVSGIEQIETQIAYIESLLQKLEGKLAIFVDVYTHSEGFTVNLR